MSVEVEGLSCPVCHSYLFNDDDIVFCPECGAPYHRECYNSVGHCTLESLHGTDKQYDITKEREKAKPSEEPPANIDINDVTCQVCSERYDGKLIKCPKCGAVNFERAGFRTSGFDMLGGVPADYDIGDGVTADEAKRFVVSNTPRYIPKFAALNAKNRISWNWFAFLIPCSWFFSRKMHKAGLLTGVLSVAASLMAIPFQQATVNMPGNTGNLSSIAETLSSVSTNVLILSAVGITISIALRVCCALFGDYLYKNHAVSEITRIKSESTDTDFDYKKYGGISFVGFFISFIVVQYLLPTAILYCLQLV